MQRMSIVLASVLLVVANAASAVTPEVAQKLVKEVTPALVAVQYTWDSELGRRDFVGAGLVVNDEGLVMLSISLTPPMMPDEQMKDFKIILPGDELTEIDGIIQAPYCAKRMWVKVTDLAVLTEPELNARIRRSYDLVAAGLPKKTQKALGLLPS